MPPIKRSEVSVRKRFHIFYKTLVAAYALLLSCIFDKICVSNDIITLQNCLSELYSNNILYEEVLVLGVVFAEPAGSPFDALRALGDKR